MRQRIIVLLIGVVFLCLLFGCGEKPVAEVNGEKISQERYNRYLDQMKAYAEKSGDSFEGESGQALLAELEQNVLEQLIDETLIFQAAKKENIRVTEKEVSDFLDQRVKKSFQSEEEYNEWLKSSKLTEKELKENIKYQMTGQKLFEKISGNAEVTDEKAREFFEKDKSRWEKIQVSHILVVADRNNVSSEELEKARSKAMDIIAKLDGGADFAELAKTSSDDPGSASQGGVLDMEFTRGETGLVPEFVEGSFHLTRVGEYSRQPVQSDFGFHIIKLDAKTGAFQDVQQDVKNELLQEEKNQVFNQYMEKFKKDSVIKKNLESK